MAPEEAVMGSGDPRRPSPCHAVFQVLGRAWLAGRGVCVNLFVVQALACSSKGREHAEAWTTYGEHARA